MEKRIEKKNIDQFRNYSFKNLNLIFGGTTDGNGNGDGDDDDIEKKGLKVPTQGGHVEGDGN
ncbi:hypothetical protein FHS04_000875 [Mesoflavibacter sabulilitoris]|uniref:Uncharacterized protein n=1 Tax=Mesoflavibacter zeaxanthinifaciens subsp. sabulilitoris TaxID=1520893 RepID=A0A2T1N688_9FLAO|nr:hypothetical protein [Mesoflavibacter zeaxanthinifaciens]MBB3123378.1 hypothetical protein [Mesoflavibacter zeaxanthinifaciens subsp. sabulilitoris]PSG86990.1 hypothetical protein C7H61_12835 [Mesoflavibacter zeaxanthinifaciens subsp. sabulilitoris]